MDSLKSQLPFAQCEPDKNKRKICHFSFSSPFFIQIKKNINEKYKKGYDSIAINDSHNFGQKKED